LGVHIVTAKSARKTNSPGNHSMNIFPSFPENMLSQLSAVFYCHPIYNIVRVPVFFVCFFSAQPLPSKLY